MLNAREIKHVINNKGFEKGLVYLVEALAEQDKSLHRALNELASYFNQLVDSMNGVMAAASAMKQVVESVDPREPELGSNTQRLGNDS